MSCSTKKSRRAKKAARKASHRVEDLAGTAQKSAQDSLAKVQDTVLPAVAEGAKDVRKRAGEFVDEHLPAVQDSLHAQGERISTFTDSLSPRAEKLRADVRDEYLPRARRTAGATNAVVAATVTAAVEAARKELEKGQGEIQKAYTAPTPAKKKSVAGKLLLILGLGAAGAAAGFFAWKKTRPVEDPWAPPADFARAHYPASAATDTDSSEVSDTVGGAEAGDVARSLKGGTDPKTSDRSSDVTPHDVKVDSASAKDAKGAPTTGTPASGTRTASTSGSAATGKDAGTHRADTAPRTGADGVPEQGKVIDPVMNPEENPGDPLGRGDDADGKRGTHRGDA